MRSREEIIEHFPDLKFGIEVDQIRATLEYQLGYAIGSVEENEPHHCFNAVHLKDMVRVLLIGYFAQLNELGISGKQKIYIRAAVRSHHRIAVGWFDAGRKYPPGTTVDQVMEVVENEWERWEQQAKDGKQKARTGADLSKPHRARRRP